MKQNNSHKTSWFALGLTATALAASLSPLLAATSSGDHSATAAATHSHDAMQQVPRLLPKRVMSVTGNEDWDSLRGFGKDAPMAEMMTLMMVGGSGMEHMKMAPMKKGGMNMAGMNMAGMHMAGMNMGASGTISLSPGQPLTVTVTPNPPIVGDNTLDIAVTDASGKPVTGLRLTASVAMTSMDMGTEHPRVVEEPNGHYTTVVNFSMKGPWRVMLTGSAPAKKASGPVRAALDFNVGSTEKWGQATGGKVVLNTRL